MNRPTKDLFFARAYYFAFVGGVGFVSPFVNLFYISLGINGKRIGLISSISAIVGMLISPIWVSEVKKHPQAKRLLQVAIILGGMVYFLIGWQKQFAFILLLVFLQSFIITGIAPTSDSMAVTVSRDADAGYGSVRVFASLGWIVSLLTSGWLVQRFGYIAAFSGVTSMWVIGAGLLNFIHPRYFTSQSLPAQPKTNLRLAFQRVIHNRVLLGFAFALVMIGFLNSGVMQFENVYLQELGANKQLISVAGILSAIVELPFMIFSDRIVRRVGAHRLMLIAMFLTSLQRLMVFIFPSISTIMIVRFIGGVAFSFYTISFVNLISSQTDPTETGPVLALYTVTIGGLVNIIAAPTAGALFDAIGARWLYFFAAIGYMTGVLSLWLNRPVPKVETPPVSAESDLA